MVNGDPGPAGLPVASHVAPEQDLAQEAAAVPDLLVVEKAALVQVPCGKTVIHNVVQLMVNGDPGPAGLPVASLVAQEENLASEAAAVLDLLVVEKIALDQTP